MIAREFDGERDVVILTGTAQLVPCVIAVSRRRVLVVPFDGDLRRSVDFAGRAQFRLRSQHLPAQALSQGAAIVVTTATDRRELDISSVRPASSLRAIGNAEPSPRCDSAVRIALPRTARDPVQPDAVPTPFEQVLQRLWLLPGERTEDLTIRGIVTFPVARATLMWSALILTGVGVLGAFSPKLFPIHQQAIAAVARVSAVDRCLIGKPDAAAASLRRLNRVVKRYPRGRFTGFRCGAALPEPDPWR